MVRILYIVTFTEKSISKIYIKVQQAVGEKGTRLDLYRAIRLSRKILIYNRELGLFFPLSLFLSLSLALSLSYTHTHTFDSFPQRLASNLHDEIRSYSHYESVFFLYMIIRYNVAITVKKSSGPA